MRIFGALYDRALGWARHPHAWWYLGGLSFTESSFFPVPPDVMLAPMTLAERNKAWRLAAWTTLTSVLGGIFGYLIGMFLFAEVGQAVISFYHAEAAFGELQTWFERHGVWVVLLAGFSPIPYKLFTITSGLVAMAFLPFVLASVVGRGARFFLVSGLIYFGGERLEVFLKRYVDAIGWAFVVSLVAGYFLVF